ncbi:hypothetical protein A3Q34_04935 [Colwellia sp. PAMC 20917]|uniref:CRISPR system precrRNA processing endoribonuclease RAMP protein Cas6 n=1 Tax=Colwellia sp. PAMC 20917 TaxID=1816218 RepID=UPI000878206F|nr:CRISPR system precrRNA processing endoribonuclease RAMP protein Cas6 [Colwellia sp. PAMC 20917]AOW76260.1 hypothetical protein A3Q34_04935 [Colwellia sp. PAMC 20917]
MQALTLLAQQCDLLKLRIYIQFKQSTVLPAFKGSMLHGWLGHAVKHIDERAFFALYGEHDNQQPKPYIICPNEDHKTHWQAKEVYYFDIVLIGQITQLAPTVFKALEYGQKLGFGSQKTPFSLISVSSLLPGKIKAGIHITSLLDWLTISPDAFEQRELAVNFITPVRLKFHGKILQNQAPNLPLLLKQISRRFSQLCQFWVCDEPELLRALYQELPVLGEHEQSDHIYFENWERFSLKEQRQLPFGGLKGQVSYYGEIAQALPWLQIGEQLSIGGKTTFGLGKYQLIE